MDASSAIQVLQEIGGSEIVGYIKGKTKQSIDMRSESFLPTLDLENTIMYRDYASFGQDPDAEVYRIYEKGENGEKEFIGEYLVEDVEEYAPIGWEDIVQDDMDDDNPADMVIIPKPKDLGKNKWPNKKKEKLSIEEAMEIVVKENIK
jgi:hypothetical protein